ncbi:hypothetical protein cypCar_00042479 [Cyprinus carpio]|nr:hypothetical protein cypCar_00042479 [Cyprinus carpio]
MGVCSVRRLNVIPPDSEVYAGSQIKSASASGKTMLYVVPLQESVLPCPICQLKFPVNSLELHASLCGEQNLLESPDHSTFMHNDDSCFADDTTGNSISRQVLCLEDLLELLAGRVNAENQFHICVSWDNLLERRLKQWKRQKKGNPANQLKITFIGEAGVDSGA